MSLIEKIEIAGSCFHNMMRTVIESYRLEQTGFLIGQMSNNKAVLYNAYPITTSKRKPSSVYYGDEKAIERLKRYEIAVSLKEGEISLLGGYHSHIVKKEDKNTERRSELNELSDDDLDYIREDMRSIGAVSWIEIILRLEEKAYSSRDVGLYLTHHKKKMGLTIMDFPLNHINGRNGYRIVLSGYLIEKRPEITLKNWHDNKTQDLKKIRRMMKTTELRLKERKIKIIEK